MAANAASNIGCGLVSLFCDKDGHDALLAKISPDHISGIYDELKDFGRYSSIVLGPGLGREDRGAKITKRVLEEYKGRLILDADSLFYLGANLDLLQRSGETVLTPHHGEFSRLTGIDRETLAQDPLKHALDFVRKHNVHLILKGAISFYVSKDLQVRILANPNDALSKGGSGDILAGILGGFSALKDSVISEMVELSLSMHSLAAEMALEKKAARTVTPMDVLDGIGRIISELELEQ